MKNVLLLLLMLLGGDDGGRHWSHGGAWDGGVWRFRNVAAASLHDFVVGCAARGSFERLQFVVLGRGGRQCDECGVLRVATRGLEAVAVSSAGPMQVGAVVAVHARRRRVRRVHRVHDRGGGADSPSPTTAGTAAAAATTDPDANLDPDSAVGRAGLAQRVESHAGARATQPRPAVRTTAAASSTSASAAAQTATAAASTAGPR